MKKNLLTTCFALLMLMPSLAHADILSNLAGHWKFDEGTGSTALDSSGSGNNGSLVNSPTYVSGKIGPYALSFNGSTQYVQVNAAPASSFPVTESAWVKLNSATVSAAEVITSEIQLSSLDALYLAYESNNGSCGASYELRMYSQDATGANQYVNIYAIVPDTSWHLITAVWTNATTQNLYVDGSPVSPCSNITTGTPPNPSGLDHTFFGATLYDTSNLYGPLAGSIDDECIYNRALSSTDATQLFNSSIGCATTFVPPSPSIFSVFQGASFIVRLGAWFKVF